MKVARQAQDQKRQGGPRLAEDQERPATVAVAQPAQDRAGDELAHRVRREQQADLPVAETVLRGERPQERHHQGEPEQVHQDDQHDNPERPHRR